MGGEGRAPKGRVRLGRVPQRFCPLIVWARYLYEFFAETLIPPRLYSRQELLATAPQISEEGPAWGLSYLSPDPEQPFAAALL